MRQHGRREETSQKRRLLKITQMGCREGEDEEEGMVLQEKLQLLEGSALNTKKFLIDKLIGTKVGSGRFVCEL